MRVGFAADTAMRWAAVGVLVTCAVTMPETVHAQSVRERRVVETRTTDSRTPESRGTVRRMTGAMPNACSELAAAPSHLVQAPEGMVLLRLKRELESVAMTLEQQRSLEREQVQRLAQVQRGVDSALRVVVRSYGSDGAPREVITIRRGDSARVEVEGRPLDMRGVFITVDSTARQMAPFIRHLSPAIEGVVRSLQPQVAALTVEAEARVRSAAPSGYVGLSLSGAQLRMVTPEGVFTSHCEYPMVETVDVGSPAARAGLAAGDTLLAYNGRDVMQLAVNYPELIAAGSTLRVRIRRGGKAREVPVNVAARGEERTSGTMTFVRTPSAAPRPGTPAAPTPPPMSMFGPAGFTVLAGAQFVTVDDDFASSLGLDAGVLALRVPEGSPAAVAGLRSGEVVRAVNGTPVRDATAMRRLVQAARGDVRLSVQSRNGSRVVVLDAR